MKIRKPTVGIVALLVSAMLPSIACAATLKRCLSQPRKGTPRSPSPLRCPPQPASLNWPLTPRICGWSTLRGGTSPPARQLVVGSNITSFWALDANTVYVVDVTGTLWLEHGPWGPSRTFEQVDFGVHAFWPLSDNYVYMLDTDAKLWLEHGPWAAGASRQLVAENVAQFQAMGPDNVYVEDNSNKLWLDIGPWGTTSQKPLAVDTNVETFQALNLNAIYVEDRNGILWLDQSPSLQKLPPTHQQVDRNIARYGSNIFNPYAFQAKPFQALDVNSVYVVDRNGYLWLDQGPWGSLPPARTVVAPDVNDFLATDDHTVYEVDFDRKLWLYQGPWGSGTYHQLVNDSDGDSFVLSSPAGSSGHAPNTANLSASRPLDEGHGGPVRAAGACTVCDLCLSAPAASISTASCERSMQIREGSVTSGHRPVGQEVRPHRSFRDIVNTETNTCFPSHVACGKASRLLHTFNRVDGDQSRKWLYAARKGAL